MEIGNCHPTDIDAMVEWKNDGYVFFEVKYRDAPFPTGQRLAMERLVNDVTHNGKYVIAMVVEHSESDPEVNIVLSDCILREFYTKKDGWRYVDNTMSARDAMDLAIRRMEEQSGKEEQQG
jgi:translation initiation factor RLI1